MAVEPPSLEKLRFGQPVPRHVEPLCLLCVEVIMRNGATLLQKACRMLPPSQLRYLLYRAMKSGDVTYIECLMRYWPFETLSFDMYNFIIIDDDIDDDYLDRDYLHNGIRNYLYWIGNDDEMYLQRHHSWFCSSRYPQLQFDEAMVFAIARGVYSRVFESQSVDQATSGTKQIIIDMSMVRLENPDIPSKVYVIWSESLTIKAGDKTKSEWSDSRRYRWDCQMYYILNKFILNSNRAGEKPGTAIVIPCCV